MEDLRDLVPRDELELGKEVSDAEVSVVEVFIDPAGSEDLDDASKSEDNVSSTEAGTFEDGLVSEVTESVSKEKMEKSVENSEELVKELAGDSIGASTENEGEAKDNDETKIGKGREKNEESLDHDMEGVIDSSNDEDEAKQEATKDDDINSETIVMRSDEEFANEQFKVGKMIVSNYIETKHSLIHTVKLPKNLFEENAKFKASPLSLNNRMIIVATSSNKGQHNGDKKVCPLTPACNRFWNKGDDIMKVQVLACDEIELPSNSVWVCAHHAVASIKGYALQTQKYQRYSRRVVGGGTENVEELEPKAGTSGESDKKKSSGGGKNGNRNKLSSSKKRKLEDDVKESGKEENTLKKKK